MNFFSHDVILPDDAHPLTRVGSALPDLWSRLPKRPVPFRLLPALREEGSPDLLALANGIESHLKADGVFHAHDEFLARLDQVEAELLQFWPTVGHGEMAAHILVEMMLDRWLMLDRRARLTSYYDCFTPEWIGIASQHGATTDPAREALAGVLRFFADARFLEDYVRPEGLARRFCGAWARTPFAGDDITPEAAIAEWVEQRFEPMIPRSELLVDSAREAIAPLWAKGDGALAANA